MTVGDTADPRGYENNKNNFWEGQIPTWTGLDPKNSLPMDFIHLMRGAEVLVESTRTCKWEQKSGKVWRDSVTKGEKKEEENLPLFLQHSHFSFVQVWAHRDDRFWRFALAAQSSRSVHSQRDKGDIVSETKF